MTENLFNLPEANYKIEPIEQLTVKDIEVAVIEAYHAALQDHEDMISWHDYWRKVHGTK
jgi:hypothetical protein